VLDAAFAAVQADPAMVVDAGTVNGRPLQLDASALALTDRLMTALLKDSLRKHAARGRPFKQSFTTDEEIEAAFREMVEDTVKGSLEGIRTLAGSLGTFGAVLGVGAALVGAVEAAPVLAVIGALTLVTTTLVPAVDGFVLNLAGATIGAADLPVPEETVWQAAQPEVQYVFERVTEASLGTVAQNTFGGGTPLGEAIVDTITAVTGTTESIARFNGRVLFGDRAGCPGGEIPTEIGFNPPFVRCPSDGAQTEDDGEMRHGEVRVSTSGSVGEDGTEGTITVSLSITPEQTVTVRLVADRQLRLRNMDVSFPPGATELTRQVPVFAVDDEDVEGPHDGLLTAVVVTNDPAFAGYEPEPYRVSVADNDYACGDTATSGGQGVTRISFNLGSHEGVAEVRYDMLTVPDKAEVQRLGDVVATTGGFVSGTGTLSIRHNGQRPYSVELIVTGNTDQATGWNIQVTCP
jgi:hypothetical protein